MNRGIVALTAFLGLGLAQSALANDWLAAPDQWYVSPLIGVSFEDQDRQADNSLAGQFGLGKQIADHWAFEMSLFGAKHAGYTDFRPYGVGIDLLRSLGDGGSISPYLVFGTGYMQVDLEEVPSVVGERDYNNLIGTAGIGFVAPLGDAAARFRGEVRYRRDFDKPNYGDLIVLLGLYMPVGDADRTRTSKQTKMPDADGDGVADDVDLCPATSMSAQVDKYGCELDSDGDGVANSKDRCPTTPRGTKVDARGCKIAMDSDGDGVSDDADRCPGTPRSAKVDKTGCELDDDGDGVVNSLDSCPNTAAGTRIDARGCEIREKIELPNVGFELNSARLIRETTAVLDQAAKTLVRNPELKVEAAGYTDSTGEASYNLDLSKRRAESVRQYLISKGANGKNISVKGYGEANPVADNGTLEGRKRNRRVDLRVLN